MLRVLGSLLIVVVALGVPAAPAALAQGSDSSSAMSADSMSQMNGMMGQMGGMMGATSGMMGPMGGMLGMMGSGTTTGRTRGCGGGQQSVAGGAISELPSVTINIHDGFFLPSEVTVPAGTRVVWVNQSDRPHTTTAWDRWDSGIMMPGQSCEAWFVTPGTYDYLSIVAADGGRMRGTITVQGSLDDVQPPTGSSGTLRSTPGSGY
ncbi:MAG TPA: cupredoxin domain-containing protein [Chloroflexota bacterium]|jgi:plastocyanin